MGHLIDHSLSLADVLADVGFLRSLLNKIPSINTPQKHDWPTNVRGRSVFERASAGRMLMLGTETVGGLSRQSPQRHRESPMG
jgi:hypothetical protein